MRYLCLVFQESTIELLIFWILLDGSNRSDGASLRTDQVLETHREQVPLINCEVLSTLGINGILEERDHVLKSLSLLRNSSQKDLLFHFQSSLSC